MEVTDRLTDEQIAEYREIYAIFDKDSDGYVSTSDLGPALRALGQNPSEAEIREYAAEYDADGSGSIHFPDFLAIMAKSLEHVDTMDEMLEAFRVFDSESKGSLSADELRHAMMNKGERMTNEEIDDMLRTANMDQDGHINYEEFLETLMAKQY